MIQDLIAQENRVKLFLIDEREMFQAFTNMWSVHACNVPSLASVPKDHTLLRVFHDPYRRAFCFLIGHCTFDRVPVNAVPPEIVDRMVVTPRLFAVERVR